MKAPEGFKLASYRLLDNALTLCTMLLGNNFGKENIYKIIFDLIFISIWCISQYCGVPYSLEFFMSDVLKLINFGRDYLLLIKYMSLVFCVFHTHETLLCILVKTVDKKRLAILYYWLQFITREWRILIHYIRCSTVNSYPSSISLV